MFTKRLIIVAVFLTALFVHSICAEPTIEPKGLIPNPIEIAGWQIKKLMEIVENLVNAQLKILEDIRQTVQSIADHAIATTTKVIDVVIVRTVNQMRSILQDAIDKGINITECSVLNFDKLRILRRHLVIGEIQCATSQVGELYDIIDGATKNFTDDLATVFELPKKLQKCLITITPITCITKIVDDVIALQKAIPKQILGTMLEITEYMNGFDGRVHKCQFNQFREAILGTRAIIDDLLECVHRGSAEGSGTNDGNSTPIPDDIITEISELI